MSATIGCEASGCTGLAVFRCKDCARAFCGPHQGMMVKHDTRFLLTEYRQTGRCEPCLSEELKRKAADFAMSDAVEFAKREADGPTRLKPAEREAAYEHQVEMWEESRIGVLNKIANIRDRNERLVLAASHWVISGGNGLFNCDDRPLFSAAFPEYWPSAESVRFDLAPWDSVSVAKWFVDRARLAKIPPTHTDGHKPALFEFRPRKGWIFTSTRWTNDLVHGTVHYHTVWVDGGNGTMKPSDGDINFNGLRMMALFLGLDVDDPELCIQPRPRRPE